MDGERPLRKVVLSVKVQSRSILEEVQTPSITVTSEKKWPPISTDPACLLSFSISAMAAAIESVEARLWLPSCSVFCCTESPSRLGGNLRNQGGI